MTRTASTLTAIGTAVLAAVAGSLLWLAGSFAVVEPTLLNWLLGAAAAGGAAGVLAAIVCRHARPAARAAVLAAGLLAAASSPAFLALLARLPQGEPRLADTVGAEAPRAFRASGTTTAAGTAAPTERLRVLHLNAFFGYPDPEGRLIVPDSPSDRLHRAQRLAAEVQRLQPDVLVLRGAWCAVGEGCLADRLARDLGFHAVYARANRSVRWLGFEEGAAILSRFPVADPQVWRLRPDRGAFERSIALSARIDHPGLPFGVVGVHLGGVHLENGVTDLGGAQAEHLLERLGGAVHLENDDADLAGAQAEHLLERLDAPERPVLVAGDLNLPGDHAAMTRFRQAGYEALTGDGADHVLFDSANSDWWPLWTERPSFLGAVSTPAGSKPGETRAPPSAARADGRSVNAPATPRAPPGANLRETPAMPEADAVGVPDRPGILVEFQLPVPPASHPWPNTADDDWTGDPTGDWRHATAEEVGLDPARLEQAVRDIGGLTGVQGVLIARRGRLVAERYFRGATGRLPHNMKSASKSVLSALAGLAIEQGLLGLDQPIADLLPEAGGRDDDAKQAITVRHLLTMTSGLESTSFGNYGSWVASPNWVRAALLRPLLAEPGTRFSYSTGGTHLLSATISRAAGRSTHDFAREHLFEPLGIRSSAWARDRQGVHMGGNNLSLLPRDMLKFGQLYLNRGRWGGRQVLPWRWVDQSTRPGLVGPRGRGRIYGGYGYLWWLRGARERGAYIASGYGGQYIYVAPADDLVVVVVSTEVSKGRGWRGELFGIVREGVAGSVIDRYERQ